MIAIGCDHRGIKLKKEIEKYLEENDIKFKDFGAFTEDRVDYPEYASKVAKSIQANECDLGILICGTGFGMTITANKFKGIRCAPCYDEYTSKYAKMHNNCNIIALGAENLTASKAIECIRIFLATEFEGGRHEERLKLIEEIEKANMK